MSSENRDILEAVQALAKTEELSGFESIVCKASDINTTGLTCTATPIDGTAEFFDVRLNANGQKGFVLIPKNNSIIIICQTSETSAFVSMVSEVDQIYLNGENNGGLIKIDNLKSQYDAGIAAIKAACAAGFSALSGLDGGASLSAFNAAAASIQNLNLTPLQNNTVKHGG
jgi:hypothetical protein